VKVVRKSKAAQQAMEMSRLGADAAVPGEVRGRQVGGEERQRAVARHQEGEQHREAQVHEHELHLVGEDHGPQAAALDVEDREDAGGQHARRQRQREHGREERAQH